MPISQQIQPAPPDTRRLRCEIHGAVQGVGFRPFVFRLATGLGLAGWVINDAAGVFVEVEGPEPVLAGFAQRLVNEKPPLAIFHSIETTWLPALGYGRFEIRHSHARGDKTALILPDVAACPDCLAEVLDPDDRRHGYPFTNCTNCGPRFTIIRALPYDRPNTTMERFAMCAQCQAEYENPLDRRFHAQPNACPQCGPQLKLYKSTGHPDLTGPTTSLLAQGHEALRQAGAALLAGQIVAVKGLGGFHLMVDAGNAAAVERLRQHKPRRDKPFALMAADLEGARGLCQVDEQAAALLAAPEAPIVLLPRRPEAPVALNVAPGNPYLGVMLPYTPLHHLLLRQAAAGRPVVATSGNLSDEPICTDEDEAMQRLASIADLFLVHDRPIERHADDSVAWVVEGRPRLLRRARGYAPLPVTLGQPLPTILAVGAHLKNTVALSIGRQAFISQHIGDLETAEALAAFERVIADFLRLYEAQPVAIAHDLHPDYLSTKWARERAEEREMTERRETPIPLSPSSPSSPSSPPLLIPVQHHHAHLAACLAENGALAGGPALGVTWDGSGYGADGTIWGGEFLLGDAAGYERVAYLRPFRLPGGDAAVKEPRRVALALLWQQFGDEVLAWEHLAPVQSIPAGERQVLAQMLRRGLNAPLTSSAGRLFDAIAALVGLRQRVTFEGQAAMALEFAADRDETGTYPLLTAAHERDAGGQALDWQPLVEAILADLQGGVSSEVIAARFHNALAESIVAVAQAVGAGRVALTGGCFQNRLLTERSARRLRQAGFEVLLHRQTPPNDGGISLGQIAVAAAQLKQRDQG